MNIKFHHQSSDGDVVMSGQTASALKIIGLILAGGSLAACNQITAEPAAAARPVLVTAVRYQPQVPDRSFVGSIRPRIESDLGFRVTGKVEKRLVEVGALVKPGQPLAKLDQAKAAADEARARLNRGERSVELTKNSLSYATLTADAAGVVTATLIEPGQVVAAGQTAIRVARFAEKEAVVAIPETLVGRAKAGVASVSLWSEPNKTYAAKLREIAPSADPATRTYLAKFSLPGVGDTVSLGMTATLTLADPATDRVAKLPLSALYNQGGSPSLYVVDDAGSLTLKPVKVKAYESENVIITDGVADGARIVAL